MSSIGECASSLAVHQCAQRFPNIRHLQAQSTHKEMVELKAEKDALHAVVLRQEEKIVRVQEEMLALRGGKK